MGKLEGKIALITGGNSGIGLATAKEFVNEGAYVFITGRRERELAAAVDAIGKNVIGIQGDMAKLADLDRVYAKIKQDKGRLDIVFANAGIAKSAALGDTTEELYDATFGVNVKGCPVHRAESAAADAGRRRHRAECVGRWQQRASQQQRL
jgi:NAD(P)-dependent dehydrogenase (short-subunit alcohol dehydrogenase family)